MIIARFRSALIQLVMLCGSIVSAQTVEPFTVRIDHVDSVYPGSSVRVAVVLESGPLNVSGFDFVLAHETGVLEVLGVSPGELPSGCQWEYFTWHAGPARDTTEYGGPTDTVRVIAVASLSIDHVPRCYNSVNQPVSLFTVQYRVADGPPLGCAYRPIRFFFGNCYDNRITVPASVTPVPHNEVETIAQHVLEPTGWEITRRRGDFPGWFGPADSCVSGSRSSPVPFVNLINGGIRLAGCPRRSLGDFNLNGAGFEVEDSWLFAKYLLYGDTALPGGSAEYPRDQFSQATDLNHDGIGLTLEDLVLFMRAVLGEYNPVAYSAPPGPTGSDNPFVPPPPVASTATVKTSGRRLSVESSASLIAARFVFKGRITPRLHDSRLDMYHAYTDGETRVLIYGFFTGALITPGPCLDWEGKGTLIEASLATSTGGKVQITLR